MPGWRDVLLISNARLEGWAEETFNGSGWRQVYYRRGQQVKHLLTFYRFINLNANRFTQCAKVGYYREFSPDGSEIEWGLVGGPVWKNMVKSPGNIS